MPITFHLKISRAAIHAGETSKRAATEGRQRATGKAHKPVLRLAASKPMLVVALPASPRGEPELPPTPPPTPTVPSTPRPTLDLEAPAMKRPLPKFPPYEEDDAFGGESPGFCPTGACRCGRCGYDRDYWSSSRYGYDDYIRDYTEADEEEWDPYGDDGYAIPVYVPPVDPYEVAKTRICKEFAVLLQTVGTAVGWEARERAAILLAEYMLSEPFMSEFMDRNAHFKSVVGGKMTEFGVGAKLPELKRACGEVLGRFY